MNKYTHPFLPLLALLLSTTFWGNPARAQTPPSTAPNNQPNLKAQEAELEKLESTMRGNAAEQTRLRAEIDQFRQDRTKLNANLIESTQRVQSLEARISTSEARIAEISRQESALRRSLEARRGLISEVLAALQRLGRKPPPAVLIRPEDMLEALRASMLLGSVLPELRFEANALIADLSELVRLRNEGNGEKAKLLTERESINAERERLIALVAARQIQIEGSEKNLDDERARGLALSRQSQSLRDFITKTDENQIGLARAKEQAASLPLPATSAQQLASLSQNAFKDSARLQPKIAFIDTRGLLNLPAAGEMLKTYGSVDPLGQSEKGLTIATNDAAIVSNPVDTWVLYAGPYRSYGYIVILNAGNGYQWILTGLQRTMVETGQFVLAGEPLGFMGQAKQSGAGIQKPALYVELRKDGAPIDSSPWWAKKDIGKAKS